jgi:uncharacterized repeat protein (TIGR01451 family)
MMRTLFAKWFAPHSVRPRKRRTAGRPAPRSRWCVPRLEALEDRTAPAAGVSASQWSNLNAAWQNGNLNANQATLFEGDSVAYRDVFSGLTVGPGNYVITITWQTTNSGLHALDYLTSYDYTWNGGSGSGTSVDGHALDGTGLPSNTPFTTFQIPVDPNINSGPASNFMINGRTPVGSPTNPPNQFFTMFGATITGASGYTTYPMTGNTNQTLSISFAPSVPNPVLVWGGHIASQLDWGPGSGASSIPGAPYHMSQVSLTLPDGTVTSVGSQDRALQASAVVSPTLIVVNKAADPTLASQAFNFTNTRSVFFVPGQPANFVNNFSLDGSNAFTVPPYTLPGSSGGNVELLQTTAFGQNQITEGLPAGWTLTGISVHSRISNTTTTQSGPTANLNCVEGDTLWVTFTDTFHGTSTTATEIKAAPGGPLIGTPGGSVVDTATVTGSPASFTPTGTVTYTFTGTNGTSLAGLTAPPSWMVSADRLTWTEAVTLSAGVAPDSDPTGALPAGSYQFQASYSGDGNFAGSTSAAEPLAVSEASPTLTTKPKVTTVTLGDTTPPVLTDTATLSGGFDPTGDITFELFQGGTPVFTQAVAVNGNGDYATSPGFTLPTAGTVADTYEWVASYSGDANNNPVSDTNADDEKVIVSPATPTLTTTASPATVTLGSNPVTLTDTATLSGGYHPTGNIVFELFFNGGSQPVFTQAVAVNGNGDYTTSPGFTLPTTGTVTGTYTWAATFFSGDKNNNEVSDSNPAAEVTVVSPASPTLATTASPAVTLGTTAPTLSDSAVLSGGFNPTGSIDFTLTGPGGFSFTQTVPVSGNDTYTASTTLPTTGTVAGTYTWTAHYGGDPNNSEASDQGGPAEQTVVSPAGPTISTTPNPSTATLGVTLQDVADLAGGFFPTGSITFRLYAPGVDPTAGPAAYTETVTGVNGDGAYHTSVGFAANAMGTWHWVATYNGDPNNNSASSGPLVEPVTIEQQADVAVAKAVSDPTPVVGQTISFSLFVGNRGPDTATDVVVTDLLPAGLAFVSATATQGTYDPGSGAWVVGTLPAGGGAALQVAELVTGIGPMVNNAVARADQFDPDLSNNQAAVSLVGMQSASTVSKRDFLSDTSAPIDPNQEFVGQVVDALAGGPRRAGPASVSTAFGPDGQVIAVVTSAGHLLLYDAGGAHDMGGGVRAAGVAFGPDGLNILVTFADGTLTLFDAGGAHTFGGGVRSASLAFGPDGPNMLVTFADGTLRQFSAAGVLTLGGGVLSASIAFGPQGEVIDVARPDGTLTRYDAGGAHVLSGGGVASPGLAFDPGGQEVLDVLFADGALWQFDAAGVHRLGLVA